MRVLSALPPGASLAHTRCALWNAGAAVSMLDGMFGRRPPGPGSGKLGTPCARRHRTYVSAGPVLAGAVPAGRSDPHAPTAAAPAIATRVTARIRVVPFTPRVVRAGTQHGPNGGR